MSFTVSPPTEAYLREGYAHILQHKEIPSYVSISRIHGPFLLGTMDKTDESIAQLAELPPL